MYVKIHLSLSYQLSPLHQQQQLHQQQLQLQQQQQQLQQQQLLRVPFPGLAPPNSLMGTPSPSSANPYLSNPYNHVAPPSRGDSHASPASITPLHAPASPRSAAAAALSLSSSSHAPSAAHSVMEFPRFASCDGVHSLTHTHARNHRVKAACMSCASGGDRNSLPQPRPAPQSHPGRPRASACRASCCVCASDVPLQVLVERVTGRPLPVAVGDRVVRTVTCAPLSAQPHSRPHRRFPSTGSLFPWTRPPPRCQCSPARAACRACTPPLTPTPRPCSSCSNAPSLLVPLPRLNPLPSPPLTLPLSLQHLLCARRVSGAVCMACRRLFLTL